MYAKVIENGYITIIGDGISGIQITKEKYEELLDIITHAPKAPLGYDYMLKADTLEWELVNISENNDSFPLEDKSEAYDILVGEES